MSSAGGGMVRARGAAAAVQRWWWLVALLVVLVVVGSLAQYFGPGAAQRESYLATRSLRVLVVPSGASTAYDGYTAARQEDEIARTLATSGLLSNTALDTDIAVRMRAGGVKGSVAALASTAAATLSATHSGNLVLLTARGRTATEADAIATASVEALGAGALAGLLPSVLVPLSGAALRVQVEGNASQPVHDLTQRAAAAWQILARMAIAFVAGVFLSVALGWRASRRPQAPRLAQDGAGPQ